MRDKILPGEKDWNRFWDSEKTSKFKKESWSKIRIKRILAPFLKTNIKVLDAGCGSGYFSRFFCDSGARTYSLDYSQEALETCKIMTEGRAVLVKKDILSCDLSQEIPERFELIFSDGLFEHFLPDVQLQIMRLFKKMLSPQGIIATFVPNRWSPWQLLRPFYMPGIEEHPFTLRKLVQLNHTAGLDAIAKGGINTLPFKISLDPLMGKCCGMLLYTLSRIKD